MALFVNNSKTSGISLTTPYYLITSIQPASAFPLSILFKHDTSLFLTISFPSSFFLKSTMAVFTNFLLLLLNLFLISALFVLPAAVVAGGGEFSWLPTHGGECSGSIAECIGGGEYLEMESESTRRILATTNYISYGALQGNNVPCSQRGASYYNCRSGGQANPYQRGCSTITRCRR